MTEGRSILSGRHTEVEVGKNDFELDKEKLPDFLPLSLSSKAPSCSLVLSHTISCSTPMTYQKNWQKALKMEDLTFSPDSVFIGDSYLQYAGMEKRWKYCP